MHPATERNIKQLKEDGCQFIEPAVGDLACGYQGVGRLAPVDDILSRIDAWTQSK